MKAILINGEAPGGKRTPLAERLPLSAPYVMQIFPIYACNFKCNYCHQAIPRDKRKFVTDIVSMDYHLYTKCIDDMKLFGEKIKTLRFVGMGEPLLHERIADMISYAKKADVSEKVEIITNGSLLTHEMSDSLIVSGLDRMVISLQGINSDAYKEISNVEIDFKEFVENIKYFYENKKNAHMYLKIVDIALKDENEEQQYFDIFGDICDSIAIEKTVPIFEDVPLNEELYKKNASKTQFGLNMKRVRVCPQPFYTMQINPDGKVVGCHAIYFPAILGDCNTDSVVNIWNGKLYNDFRKKMLDGRENVGQCCIDCGINDFRIFPEDDISEYADCLKEKYGFI